MVLSREDLTLVLMVLLNTEVKSVETKERLKDIITKLSLEIYQLQDTQTDTTQVSTTTQVTQAPTTTEALIQEPKTIQPKKRGRPRKVFTNVTNLIKGSTANRRV